MIGRDVEAQFPPKPDAAARRAPLLEVRGLAWEDRLNDISFASAAARSSASAASTARASGSCCSRSSACSAASSGEVAVDGRAAASRRARAPPSRPAPHRADPRGPQDRGADAADVDRRQPRSPRSRPRLPRLVIDRARRAPPIADAVAPAAASRSARPTTRSRTLSGGNQQKVVIAKWLMTGPASSCSTTRPAASTSAPSRRSTACCATSPTQGTAILFYSTDYEELIGCCDRVLILYGGRIVRELAGDAHHRDEHRRRRAQHRRRSSASAAHAAAAAHRATAAAPPAPAPARCSRSASSSRSTSPIGCTRAASPPTSSCRTPTRRVALGFVADGADPAGADRRPRPVGRRGDDAGQLRRLRARQRHAGADRSSACVAALAAGAALRPGQRPRRRLRPAPADHRHPGDRRHLHRHRPLRPADPRRRRRRRPRLGDDQRARRLADTYGWATAARPGGSRRSPASRCRCCPRRHRAARLAAVPPLRDRPRRLRRRLDRGRRLHVGRAGRPRQARRLHARPASSPPSPGSTSPSRLGGQRRPDPGRHLHAQLDRRRGDRRHLAARRRRRRHRLDLRRAGAALIIRSASASGVARTRCCSRCSRGWSCSPPSASARVRVLRIKNRLEMFR